MAAQNPEGLCLRMSAEMKVAAGDLVRETYAMMKLIGHVE